MNSPRKYRNFDIKEHGSESTTDLKSLRIVRSKRDKKEKGEQTWSRPEWSESSQSRVVNGG